MKNEYVPLIRKTRPKKFEDLLGQPHVNKILSKQLSSGTATQTYLFTGPAGVGKTSLGRILAARLNCLEVEKDDPNPCGECSSCRGIFEGKNVNVREVNGGADGKIDNIRELINAAGYSSGNRYRIFIIDECHGLTSASWGALLKDLEEPNSNVKWILLTTEEHKVIKTIKTRSTHLKLREVKGSILVDHLEELLGTMMENKECEVKRYDKDALKFIADLSDGSVRQAMSILDKMISYEEITIKTITEAEGRADTSGIKEFIEDVKRGNLRAAGKKLTAIYNSKIVDDFLNYLFRNYFYNMSGMNLKDRKSTIDLIRSLSDHKPSEYRDSINRELLLFKVFDAFNSVDKIQKEEPKETKKTRPVEESKESPDTLGMLVDGFLNKLIENNSKLKLLYKWNGKRAAIEHQKGWELFVCSKKSALPEGSFYVIPAKKIPDIMKSTNFSLKGLKEQGLLKKLTIGEN